MNPADYRALLLENVPMMDVRAPVEFAKGAFPGAVNLPLMDDILIRVRETAPQSRLNAAARRRNLQRAFAVREGILLPAHVALVDDVMTTGATLHAAANALLRAGVTRVDAWVCARVA